jgi:hypothetical protein
LPLPHLQDAARFAEYQALFRMNVDSFSNLELVRKEYEKNRAIWGTLTEWERLTAEWMQSRTDAIDLDDLQAKADEYARSVYKMSKMYKVGGVAWSPLPLNVSVSELNVPQIMCIQSSKAA